MPNIQRLLFRLGLLALLTIVQVAFADDCVDSLVGKKEAISAEAQEILQSLDFAIPYGKTPPGLIAKIEGKDFDDYIKAELFVLKYLYQRSDSISAARIFLERLDALELLNRLFDHPHIFTRQRGSVFVTNLGFDKEKLMTLNSVTREAFLLTALALANRHPFLVLGDERIIPILTESFFKPPQRLEENRSDGVQMQMVRIQRKLSAARNQEVLALLRGNALQLSARTKPAADRWSFWLKTVTGSNPKRVEEVRRLLLKLNIKLNRENLPKVY